MTTITISDKLRQKLKQLVSKYDTTQADIIKKALELFEKYEPQIDFDRSKNHNLEKNRFSESSDNGRNAKVKKVLAEAITNFGTNYPEIAQLRKKLQQNLPLLDEATIANWSLPFEE